MIIDTPLSTCLERNENRPPYSYVPPERIILYHQKFEGLKKQYKFETIVQNSLVC